MRKARVLPAALFGLFLPALAQRPAALPDKPISPNAGRVLQLREDLRLTDEGGEFFLKSPRLVVAATDGTLYLWDQEQIIHFDAVGKFLGNLFRKGQGPGELNYVSGMAATPEGLAVHNNSPNKLVWFDTGGRYRSEASFQKAGSYLDFLGFVAGRALGLQRQASAGGAALVREQDNALLAISLDGREIAKPAAFTVRTIHADGAMTMDPCFGTILASRFVAVSHTKDYAVTIVDLLKPGPVRVIGRRYEKVLRPKGERGPGIRSKEGKSYTLPGAEFQDDIAALHAYKDVLWVQTSTQDSDKGILFDVFDAEGRYLDAFYLKFPGRLLNVQGDSLFIRESAPDDTLRIVRYKVVG
jgi:hypothetical protein